MKNLIHDLVELFALVKEFLIGRYHLRKSPPLVTIYGSARLRKETPEYKLTVEIAKRLAQRGYGNLNGGGPGIMEAAAVGAKEAGGFSIGCNIELPFEQIPNPHNTVAIQFNYFTSRKMILSEFSRAFVVMPGGFGTIDEFSEILCLIQTKKRDPSPMVFVGREFWRGFFDWMENTVLKSKLVNEKDFRDLTVLDTPEEFDEWIDKHLGAR